MNTLLPTHLFLSQALAQGDLSALALLTVWLDPLWMDVSESDELDPNTRDYADGDPKLQALLIARRCFPELYVEAISQLHQGCTASQLEEMLCEGFTQAGIPLDEGGLEMVGWGIPLPAYGVLLNDPDFYTTHPETVPILACFSISPEPHPYDVDVPHIAYRAAQILALNLNQNESEICQQVSWLLQWLFSFSNNSSVDLDWQTLAEIEPLVWDEEEVDFAIHLISEADEILKAALAGLVYLYQHPAALQTFENNVKHVYAQIAKQKGEINDVQYFAQDLKLDWSALAGSTL
jgi:hypothetical protein